MPVSGLLRPAAGFAFEAFFAVFFLVVFLAAFFGAAFFGAFFAAFFAAFFFAAIGSLQALGERTQCAWTVITTSPDAATANCEGASRTLRPPVGDRSFTLS